MKSVSSTGGTASPLAGFVLQDQDGAEVELDRLWSDRAAGLVFLRHYLCVQCRACEVACPSAVPFGRLMEGARSALVTENNYQPWWRRLGYRALGHHRLVLTGSAALAVAQRTGLVPSARLGLPDRFVEHGERPELLADLGLDAKGIAAVVRRGVRREMQETELKIEN